MFDKQFDSFIPANLVIKTENFYIDTRIKKSINMDAHITIFETVAIIFTVCDYIPLKKD